MTTYDIRAQAFAGALAALAGYVDALGFGATGGFFVSFMSGNTTRMGFGIMRGNGAAMIAAGLVTCFLVGVVAGALVGHSAGLRRPAVVLAIVSLLLAFSAACQNNDHRTVAIGLTAASMGVLNNVFARRGEVSIGLTYMTGSLVKLGQRIAATLLGGPRFGWVPFAWLWTCFVLGVLGGAATFPEIGLEGLWGGAMIAAGLAIIAPARADR